MGQGSPKELVKAYGNAKLENGPRMPKESKWAKDAQEEMNWTKEPTNNVMGQESPKQYKPNDSTELLELSRRKMYFNY